MSLTEKNILLERAKKLWIDLVDENSHPLPCECGACLYLTLNKRPIKKRGGQFRKLRFFLSFLIHEVKLDHLEEHGKAKKIFFWGHEVWITDEVKIDEQNISLWSRERLINEPGDYEKAPYFRETKALLEKLSDSFTEAKFGDPLETLINLFPGYHSKLKKENFLALVEELRNERLSEWTKGKESLSVEDFKLARRVSEFVRSRPKQKAFRRDILHRFTISKDDLERINILLGIEGIEAVSKRPKGRLPGQEAKTILYKAHTDAQIKRNILLSS